MDISGNAYNALVQSYVTYGEGPNGQLFGAAVFPGGNEGATGQNANRLFRLFQSNVMFSPII